MLKIALRRRFIDTYRRVGHHTHLKRQRMPKLIKNGEIIDNALSGKQDPEQKLPLIASSLRKNGYAEKDTISHVAGHWLEAGMESNSLKDVGPKSIWMLSALIFPAFTWSDGFSYARLLEKDWIIGENKSTWPFYSRSIGLFLRVGLIAFNSMKRSILERHLLSAQTFFQSLIKRCFGSRLYSYADKHNFLQLNS